MKVALATFPRSPGERRIELDLEHRKVLVAFYVPQLGKPPRVEQVTAIRDDELDAHIDALTSAREQLRAAGGAR